jgi:hypothetical protein
MLASDIMKQYVIDELRYQDYEKIKTYFDELFGESDLAGIYWLPLDPEILTEVQAAHTTCQPYYFVLDLAPECLSCELLIRTRSRIRCNCISYADERQRNWIIKTLDAVLEKLEIIS